MELLLLLGFGLAALAGGFSSSSSSEAEELDPIDPENPDDNEPTGVEIGTGFTLSPLPNSSSFQLIGSDGDDVLLPTDRNGSENYISRISAGAGNDVIDLVIEDESYGDYNSFQVPVDGGAGNDAIRVVSPPTDEIRVEGGDGDDTIVAVGQAWNARFYGGAGNDDMTMFGQEDSGAGYTIHADGGVGDDTLRADATDVLDEPFGDGFDNIYTFNGGEGRDVLQFSVAEGTYGDSDEIPQGHSGIIFGGDLPTYAELYIDRSHTGETFSIESTILFEDFTVGEDRLALSVESVNDEFNLASIRMEVDAEVSATAVIVRYESDTSLDREVTVWLGAIGVTWDDVDLVGADRSILVPLTLAS